MCRLTRFLQPREQPMDVDEEVPTKAVQQKIEVTCVKALEVIFLAKSELRDSVHRLRRQI